MRDGRAVTLGTVRSPPSVYCLVETVVALAASAGLLRAQAGRPDRAAVRVDSIFAPHDRSTSPGCVLGVSHNGSLVYERGYGMATLEHGLAITPASIFHVASIAKQFTAASILLLARRGQLSLDDEVRQYITELPNYGSPFTLRHLLTHTSGLRDAFQLGDVDPCPHRLAVGVVSHDTSSQSRANHPWTHHTHEPNRVRCDCPSMR